MWLVGVFDISISREKKFQLMFWGQPKKIEAAMKYTILLICFIAYLNRGNNVNWKYIHILLKYIQNTLRNVQFFMLYHAGSSKPYYTILYVFKVYSWGHLEYEKLN